MTLLRKELRSLLPLLVLVLLVHGADIIYEPFFGRLDEEVFGDTAFYPGEGWAAAFVIMIISLMAGYSLFPREHDEGTIHFLHSLPVSRTRIFLAKVAAASIVLVSGAFFGDTTNWLLSLANEGSLTGHQASLQVFVGVGVMYSAFSLIILAHGVLLSFFRRFGLVLYGIAAWVVIALESDPGLAIIDPTHLCNFEYDGTTFLYPWPALALHGGLALAALAVAWFLWSGPGERVGRAFIDFADKPWGKVALGCGSLSIFGIVFSFFVLLGYREAKKGETPDPEVRWVQHQAAVPAETPHFRFMYPANLRDRALVIIKDAEDAHAKLRAILGARDGAPIVADLTEQSAHHAGIAQWQKIRVSLLDEERESDDELRHVFHHETAHALQFQESEGKITHAFPSTQFFIEGGAEWAAFESLPRPEMRALSRKQAAAAVKRLRIRFDDLCDALGFAARHDKNLVYPVGETWVAALAEAYGKDAPGKVLRAVARPDAPRGLEPLAFWQDALQACGYDLERVIAAWGALLDDVAAKEKDFLDALPRIHGGVSRVADGRVVFVASLDRDALPGCTYALRARANPTTSEEAYVHARGTVRADGAIEFSVPSSSLPGAQFEFALGVRWHPRLLPQFEDWQTGVLGR